MKYTGHAMSDRYERFQTFDDQFLSGVRTNTEMLVRRFNRLGRDEIQIRVEVFTHHQKSNRVNRAGDSFSLEPKDAIMLALAVSPELKDLVQGLIFGQEPDELQNALDKANKIVDLVGRDTFRSMQ